MSNWIRTRAQMLAAMKISSNTMTSLKRAALRGPEERPNVLRGLTAEQRQRAKDAAENLSGGRIADGFVWRLLVARLLKASIPWRRVRRRTCLPTNWCGRS